MKISVLTHYSHDFFTTKKHRIVCKYANWDTPIELFIWRFRPDKHSNRGNQWHEFGGVVMFVY